MIFTDPNTETMCKLLGGICFKGITLSRDQVDALMKLYGFHHERKEDWPVALGSGRLVGSGWRYEITQSGCCLGAGRRHVGCGGQAKRIVEVLVRTGATS